MYTYSNLFHPVLEHTCVHACVRGQKRGDRRQPIYPSALSAILAWREFMLEASLKVGICGGG